MMLIYDTNAVNSINGNTNVKINVLNPVDSVISQLNLEKIGRANIKLTKLFFFYVDWIT